MCFNEKSEAAHALKVSLAILARSRIVTRTTSNTVCFNLRVTQALSGRKFGGNIVKVTYYPLAKFESKEFA